MPVTVNLNEGCLAVKDMHLIISGFAAVRGQKKLFRKDSRLHVFIRIFPAGVIIIDLQAGVDFLPRGCKIQLLLVSDQHFAAGIMCAFEHKLLW